MRRYYILIAILLVYFLAQVIMYESDVTLLLDLGSRDIVIGQLPSGLGCDDFYIYRGNVFMATFGLGKTIVSGRCGDVSAELDGESIIHLDVSAQSGSMELLCLLDEEPEGLVSDDVYSKKGMILSQKLVVANKICEKRTMVDDSLVYCFSYADHLHPGIIAVVGRAKCAEWIWDGTDFPELSIGWRSCEVRDLYKVVLDKYGYFILARKN